MTIIKIESKVTQDDGTKYIYLYDTEKRCIIGKMVK